MVGDLAAGKMVEAKVWLARFDGYLERWCRSATTGMATHSASIDPTNSSRG
jgi:hypothetical protein